MTNQTIYALSTAWGKSGVAIIRISGQNAKEVVRLMTNLETVYLKPRYAYFTPIFYNVSRETLDKALLLYFQAPHSFTGEDCVEIQCHGSKAVITAILDSLSTLPDFRMATQGEFTKRAFLNKKMDLTEVDALLDLINSETEIQRKSALLQMEGNLKEVYKNWRSELLKIYSYLEAYIDFPDEEIPDSIKESILNGVFKLIKEIDEHFKTAHYSERLRDGFRVVIAGPTNAGKSSLLNLIAQRQAAIVSDIAGTTRDALDIYLDVGGYPVIITDTAGLRESSDKIEQQGIEITKEKIKDADYILALFDASKDTPAIFKNLKKESKNNILYIANKSDTLTFEQCSAFEKQGCLLLSAKTGKGLENLLKTLANRIESDFSGAASLPLTRARYHQYLQNTLNALKDFSFDKEIELSAEDIRLAARELGKITGQIEVEEILNNIFSSFCIGK